MFKQTRKKVVSRTINHIKLSKRGVFVGEKDSGALLKLQKEFTKTCYFRTLGMLKNELHLFLRKGVVKKNVISEH